jgi:ABC-2 type transport system ATP-binding protein
VPAVATDDLRKTYGRIEALKGVSIAVEPGQIFGLLGQNGAGKSTLIKILLGIVKLTDGEAELLGKPAGNTEVRRRVGYLPEDHQFPQYHSANSLLDIYGQMYGLSRADRRKRAAEALDYVGLKKRADYKIRTYSKGMKQRLGIASAFFHDPEVIFLDEPTDGVDPVGRKEIRDLLLQLKGEGRTIFVNSHLLGEVEMISDRVAILHRGELKHLGTVAELTRQEGRFVVGLAPGQTFPTEEVARLGYRVQPAGERFEVVVGDRPDAIDGVLALLGERGLRVRHLVEQKRTLEDVFVGMVEGSAEPGVDARRPVRQARKLAPREEDR